MFYSRKRTWIFSLAIVLGSFLPVTHATVGTPTVSRSGTQMIISWPAYTGDKNFEGYAVNWSDNQLDLKIDQYPRQYLGKPSSLSVRGADFDRNDDYYFRVFLWTTDGNTNKKVLVEGSQILRWRENSNFVAETAVLAANDPVISQTTSSTSGNADTDIYNFPNLSARAFDTFVRFVFSRPNLASNEFDGTNIELSDSSDFSNILITLKADGGDLKGEIQGLTPNTTYYARGSYHKNDRPLGEYATKTFKTLPGIPRDGRSRASRNIQKIERKKIHPFVNLGGTTSSTTSTSSSSTSTTTSTASSFDSSTTDTTAINNRIKELESLIRKYQNEIRTLRAKLPRTSRSTSSRTSRRSSVRSGRKIDINAIRARLRARRR